MSKLRVCAQKCDQCLFSNSRIVSKKRMQQILQDCKIANKQIPILFAIKPKTLFALASMKPDRQT